MLYLRLAIVAEFGAAACTPPALGRSAGHAGRRPTKTHPSAGHAFNRVRSVFQHLVASNEADRRRYDPLDRQAASAR